MKRIELLAAPILALVVACSESPSIKPEVNPSESVATPAVALDAASDETANDLDAFTDEVVLPEYSIIDRAASPPQKLAIDIRLPKKVSEQELATIARHLKNQEVSDFDRIFILYYLPEMQVGAGAWASSHFDPELEVKILGLSQDQESEAVESVEAVPNKIGMWLDDRPYVGATNVLYEEDGAIKLKVTYKDGSGSDATMVESVDARGRKFVDQEGNDFGEYYLLDASGGLSVYDNDGLILRMKKKS
ncbi:MAG: hypothetical protein RLO80_12705 [Hyphomonas sp.]